MIILLGIIGELASIMGSIKIISNTYMDALLEVYKKGYKIDPGKMKQLQGVGINEKQQKNSQMSKVFIKIAFFIPGLNLLMASIYHEKIKKIVINDVQLKTVLVPMTEKEKAQYARLKTKMEKVAFVGCLGAKQDDDDDIFVINGNPIVVLKHTTFLNYDRLLPLAYTLDEVKKLNAATTYSYQLGRADGANVAIIGIPPFEETIEKVAFQGNIATSCVFEAMTEEEAKDKTFVVYPLTMDEDTKVRVEEAIRKIEKTRTDIERGQKVEHVTTSPLFIEDYDMEKVTEEQETHKQKVLKLK